MVQFEYRENKTYNVIIKAWQKKVYKQEFKGMLLIRNIIFFIINPLYNTVSIHHTYL